MKGYDTSNPILNDKGQSQGRISSQVPPCLWIEVSMPVLVQPRLFFKVMPREPEVVLDQLHDHVGVPNGS